MANRSKEASLPGRSLGYQGTSMLKFQLDPTKFGGAENDNVDKISATFTQTAVSDTIGTLIAHIKPKRLEKLKARRYTARASQKPVDSIASVA